MGRKEVSVNRKAYHDYFIDDTYEAGMVLLGSEIKSIRKGKVQFKEAYISFSNGEAFIKGMHIAQYKEANIFNHDETRTRKLLLHKKEILKLNDAIRLQGYTLVPLKLYFKKNKAKILLGLCKGKKTYDKRETIKERDIKRNIEKNYKLR